LFLLQLATIDYKNAGDFDDPAGEQEMECKMWESAARCRRLGTSV